MKTCKFLNEECKVETHRTYEGTGMKVIQLVCMDGEPMATATTNIPELWDNNNDPNMVFIKNYTENTGIAEALTEAGIIERIETIHLPPWDAEVVVAKLVES